MLVVTVVLTTASLIGAAFLAGLGDDALWPVSWVTWAPVGALILWRRPGNGVGRALLGVGVSWGVSFATLIVAEQSASLDVRVWSELVNTQFGVLPWLGIIWLLLVFPSGRLGGRIDKAAAVGLIGVGSFAVFSFAVTPEPMFATGVPSPLAIPSLDGITDWFVTDGFVSILVLLLAALVSLSLRWRNSTGIERHQFRWLLLGGLVFGIILAVSQVLPEDSSVEYSWIIAGMAIPGSVGVAVSRYRLFEIDRIISRTVSYTILVVFLGALFAAVVVGVPNVLPGVEDSNSPLLVAVGTLAVAAVFNPLRERVQVAVDRRFNRSRYDAERVMDQFADALREEIDAHGIVTGWTRVVTDTMEPASIAVWTRSR